MGLSRMPGGWKRLKKSRLLPIVTLAASLAGCSSLPDYANPVAWYRDLSGASKNDSADQNQRNVENLEAGSKEPYPNLSTVPATPDRALSTAELEKLQNGLIADRANAKYSSQQVSEGHGAPPIPGEEPKVAVAGTGAVPVAGAAAPAAAAPAPAGAAPAGAAPAPRRQPAAPVKGSEPAPAESSLTSPSIANLPQGEAPRAAPPAPGSVPPRQQQLAVVVPTPPVPPAQSIPVEPALQPSIMRAPGGKRPSVTLEAAEIAFAGDGKTLSGPDSQHLADVARLQKQAGASLRVIGYAARSSGADAAQQDLASFGQALDRANTVAAALTKLGVPGGRVTVQAAPALVGGGLPAGQVVVLLDY